MDTDKFIKGLEPVMKMAAESHIWSKTLMRHYIKTISELTGKSEKKIKEEINEIFSEVKEESINKIKKDGSKS